MSKALERPQSLVEKQPEQVYKSPEQKAKATAKLKLKAQKPILRVVKPQKGTNTA